MFGRLRFDTFNLCHPEACLSPKDLVVDFGVDFAFSLPEQSDPKGNTNPNRKVLRPKKGAQDDRSWEYVLTKRPDLI